jgi:hypothetical protein
LATSAKTWRQAREEGVEIKLPSGHMAAVRPIEADFFVMHGSIPDPLAATLNSILDGQTVKIGDITMEELERKKTEWLPFLNELASFALVEPICRNVEAGTPLADNEISVWDLSYADKIALYRFFCQPADFLKTFRQFQIDRLAALDAAKDHGPTAVQNDPPALVGEPRDGNAGSVDSDQL